MPNKLKSGDQIVPGYALVRRLGAGGSGEVWVARASGGVQVAIKVISDLALIASDRELDALRIVREAKHPNLCPLFGVWFFDADHNLLSSKETESILGTDTDVTETVVLRRTKKRDADPETPTDDGGTLSIPDQETTQPVQMVVAMGLGEQTLMDRLIQVQAEKELAADQAGQADVESSDEAGQVGIDVDELMRYMASSASAIDELNQRHNIYHCDIKPQNILLVGGQAQVCDFGLARKVEDSRKTTIAFGTPAYGAPEMLFERTYSKTIDQYSLAVTYYELRTGKLPYSSVTQSALLRAKATGEVDLSRIPPAEAQVIARATDLDPEKRYKSCQAMVAALGEALVNPDAVTVRIAAKESKFAKPIAFVLVGLLLAVAGFAVPWSSLANKLTTADTSDQRELEPAQPTIENDPSNLDSEQSGPVTPPVSDQSPPASLESEGLAPEIVPEPAPPDTDAKVAAALEVDLPDSKRVAQALSVLRASDVQPVSLTAATIEQAVAVLERLSVSQLEPERSTAEIVRDFVESLVPIAKQQSGDQETIIARLELIALSAATSIAHSSGQSVSDQEIQAVRQRFDDGNQYAHRAASGRAAIAVAKTWLPKLDRQDWDPELAESDMQRAHDLGSDAEADRATIGALHSSYLTGLLNRRRGNPQPQRFDLATIRAAKVLEDDEAFGSLARSAIALADPNRQSHQPKSVNADAAYLQSIPDQLHATYLIGAGWNHWNQNKNRAVDFWKQASNLESIAIDSAAADRQLVASHLLEYLRERANVADDHAMELRYRDRAAAMGSVLSIVQRLAVGDQALVQRADSEKFICSVAAGDLASASESWQRVESQTKRVADLTAQQGRALFDFAMLQIESSAGKPSSEALNQLLLGCNAQVDPQWFGPAEQQPDDTQRNRNDLFRRCFKPTLEQIRDRVGTVEQVADANIDPIQLALFCERLVTLMTEHDYRSNYGAVVPYLRDIELAASIAGRNSNRRDQRSEFFFHATHAFARAIHEEQDDRPYLEWIQTFIDYRDQAMKFGTNAYTDCLEGLVAKEEALRETDRERSYNLYAKAIAKFSSAIGTKQEKLPALRSISHAGRARARQRAAIMEQGDRQESLLQNALQDARLAKQLGQEIPAVSEYILEDLARICCAVSQIPETRPADEKYALIVEAKHAINEAIAIRKNASLDDSQLAISKLFVHWIATMVITEPPHARATLLSALDWSDKTEEIGRTAQSSRLKCHWYFYAAMIQQATGEWRDALEHLVTARQISRRDLQQNELITHLTALGYVTLKSNQLEVGSRQEKLRLIDELTRDLNAMIDPTPPIANKRDEYLGHLKRTRTEMSRGR